MRPKKGWLTLAMVGLLAALLVGTGVAWATNKVEPVKRNVVQASENNLVPQEIKDDTGGGKTGKVEKEAENVPGESIIIFGKIHQDGTREPVKVFKGEPQLNVKAIVNAETGDVEFVPVKKTRVDENNLTPQEIKDETGGAKTGKIATTKEIAGKKADETSAPGVSTDPATGRLVDIVTPDPKGPQPPDPDSLPEKEMKPPFLGNNEASRSSSNNSQDPNSNPTNSTTATIWHKARADNYRIGWYAEAYSSNYNGGAGAESDGASVSAWYW